MQEATAVANPPEPTPVEPEGKERLSLVSLARRLDALEARLTTLEASATHDTDLMEAMQQTLAGVQAVPDQVRASVEPQLALSREVLAALAPLGELVGVLKARPELLAPVAPAQAPEPAAPAAPSRHAVARPPASAAPNTGGKQVEARAPVRPPASAGRPTGAPAPHVRQATFSPPPGAGPAPVAPVAAAAPVSGDLVPTNPKGRLGELLAEGEQLVNGLDPTIAAIVRSQLQSLKNNLSLMGG